MVGPIIITGAQSERRRRRCQRADRAQPVCYNIEGDRMSQQDDVELEMRLIEVARSRRRSRGQRR
jgi:hypothetical protein